MSTIRMREQITLKQLSVVSDGAGGYTSTDTTVGTFWARFNRLGANGNTEEGREYLEDSVLFTCRYNEFIISKIDDFKVVFNSKTYKINSVINQDERDKYLLIYCTNED